MHQCDKSSHKRQL